MPFTDSFDHESPSKKKRAERKQKTAERQYAEQKAIKAQKTIDGTTSQIVDERTGKVVNTLKLSPAEKKSFERFDKNKGEAANSSDLPNLSKKESDEVLGQYRESLRQIKKNGGPQPNAKQIEEMRNEFLQSARREKGERRTFKGVAKSIFSEITSQLNKLKDPEDNMINVPTAGGISGAINSGVHGRTKNPHKRKPQLQQKRQPTTNKKKNSPKYFTGVGV